MTQVGCFWSGWFGAGWITYGVCNMGPLFICLSILYFVFWICVVYSMKKGRVSGV